MLKICASENFAKDVRKMECLFGDEIKNPQIGEPDEPKPKEGKKELTETQERIYDAKIMAFVKEEKSMEESLTALYNISWGQYIAMMQNRLESLSSWEDINKEANVARLLKEVRNINNELQVSVNIYDALDDPKRKYFAYYQSYEESNIKHVKNIKDLVATVEHYGGSVCEDEGLLEYEKKKDGNVRTSKNYPGIVRAKVMGYVVIKRANAERFGDLLKDLRKQHSYGQDIYPDSVEVAHNMLNKNKLLYEKKKKHGTK